MSPVNFDLGIDDVESHLAESRHYLVGDVLAKRARTSPDEVAIVGETGATTTYRELHERTNRLANALLAGGYGYGDRVAIVSENRPEYLEVVYACARLGALCAALNWRQTERELRHCLDVADADVLVVSRARGADHEWLRPASGEPHRDTDADRAGRDEDARIDLAVTLDDLEWGRGYEATIDAGSPGRPAPTPRPTPEDGVLVLFTSGTTGLPKGAVLSHRALLARAVVWKEVASMGPSVTNWKPMFHLMGTEPALVAAMDGGTVYTIDGFQPELILERYTRSRQGYLPLALGTVEDLLAAYEAAGYGPSDFEHAATVGSMADLYPPERIRRVTEAFDAAFLNTYGATETGAAPLSGNTIAVGVEPTTEDIHKSEGPLVDLRLVADGSPVEDGDVGELLARGPTVCSGYAGDADANREAFTDGWFATGDLFVRRGADAYEYVDRTEYLIKCGGENVYPAAVERAMKTHERVEEVCVARTPDVTWGEVPVAYVATSGSQPPDKAELIGYLRGKVASYELPHYVAFVDRDRFPRSTSGKIRRVEVEEWPDGERVRDPSA